jgi:hypothetical protein
MKKNQKADARRIREAPLLARTDLGEAATADIAGPMNAILADVFAIYLVATASLIENWIDETERRVWFLFETTRK